MPSARCAAAVSLGWVTAYDWMAARVAAVGCWRCAETRVARSATAQPGDDASRSAARALHQGTGIVFAKEVHIVLGQCPHQLEMQIVHHTRASGEELLMKDCARVVDPLPQSVVKIATRASGLHGRAVVKPHLRDLHASEALSLE